MSFYIPEPKAASLKPRVVSKKALNPQQKDNINDLSVPIVPTQGKKKSYVPEDNDFMHPQQIPLTKPKREQTPAPYDKPDDYGFRNVHKKEYNAEQIGGVNFPSLASEEKYVPSKRAILKDRKSDELTYLYHPDKVIEEQKEKAKQARVVKVQ